MTSEPVLSMAPGLLQSERLAVTVTPVKNIPLRDAVFVVTDTETTGTSSGSDRLIEIAAVKVRGGQIIDRFDQLINPHRSIPRYITELTGISTAMVFNQPSADEVMPRFMEFLGDGVLVAHNLAFDRHFIDAELARIGRPPWTGSTLCTLRLARRLLHGLRSKGLSSLAEFYGLKIKNRHRALGDAEATAEILLRFLSRLEFENSISTLGELLTFQNRRYSQPKSEPKHIRRIREQVLGSLPDRPGVYFMLDTKGNILYIGKAKRLSSRVRSYFTGIEGHAPHIRKLLEAVRDVRWTETGSELSALLLESRLIKERQPPYNRAQLRYRHRPFLRLDVSDQYPRISWASFLTDDGAEYFGPVGGRGWAEQVVDIVNRFFKLRECNDDVFVRHAQCVYEAMSRCDGPCDGGLAAESYGGEVRKVRDFLVGRDWSVLERIEVEMKAAAGRLDYEQAATFRNWLQRLQVQLTKQQAIATSVLDHNAALVLPGLTPETIQVFLVRYGRLAATLTMDRFPRNSDLEALRSAVSSHFKVNQHRPHRYHKEEIEEVRILSHWLYVYRDSARQVPWSPDLSLNEFITRILARFEDPITEESGEEEV